jgi:hypothetical protein
MTAKSELCPAVSFRDIVSKTPLQILATGRANYQKVNRFDFFASERRAPASCIFEIPSAFTKRPEAESRSGKNFDCFFCLVLPETFSFYAVPRHERIYEMINGDYF